MLLNLRLISAYFYWFHAHKSEEGFKTADLVPRQFGAFCGLLKESEELWSNAVLQLGNGEVSGEGKISRETLL